MAYARTHENGQLDVEATLDVVNEICERNITLKECIEQLRELVADAIALANNEGYDDGMADAQKQEGVNYL